MSWKNVRIALYIVTFLTGVFTTLPHTEPGVVEAEDEDSIVLIFNMIFTILILLLMHPMFTLVIGFQAKNPLSAKVWYPPDHTKNPLDITRPLYFFHFGAFFGICHSLGLFVGMLWHGWDDFESLIMLLVCGNLLWAVKRCERIFDYKFEEESIAS